MSSQDDPEKNDDPYKFYFQIDTEWINKYMDSLIKKMNYEWIDKDIFEEIISNLPQYKIEPVDGFPFVSLPVNSWFSSIAEDKTSLYLGNNYWNEGVWKKKHFIQDKLGSEYVKHLQSHAGNFLQQPKYYKGLYEILN